MEWASYQGSIYVRLKRSSNVSNASADLVELSQSSVASLSTNVDVMFFDGNKGDSVPTTSSVSNSTSYASPILIDDDELTSNSAIENIQYDIQCEASSNQNQEVTNNHPEVTNNHSQEITNNHVQEVTNNYTQEVITNNTTVSVESGQIICEQTSTDDIAKLAELFPYNTNEQLLCLYNLQGFLFLNVLNV